MTVSICFGVFLKKKKLCFPGDFNKKGLFFLLFSQIQRDERGVQEQFFKMLSEWRDGLGTSQSEDDSVHALAVALREVHRNDIAQLVTLHAGGCCCQHWQTHYGIDRDR